MAAVGERLGLDAHTAAVGISEVVDENMTNAARVHAVENGRDLGGFTMIAFGGGGPLHASRLIDKLGLDELLVPPDAGVGSAIGFPPRAVLVRSGPELLHDHRDFDFVGAGHVLADAGRRSTDFRA